ncbi:hypothetical protein ES702_07521 [subsurface metagenome]
MELNEFETLRLVEERIILKVHSFRTWENFITWIKGMTQVKFKAFILQCLDDVVADGDAKKADLLEAKTSIEG